MRKFAYDIWGDIVNTTGRMESSGEVGQVNISEATYALVTNEPGLTFTPRGKAQAKGKAEMEMYFVESWTATEVQAPAATATRWIPLVIQRSSHGWPKDPNAPRSAVQRGWSTDH